MPHQVEPVAFLRDHQQSAHRPGTGLWGCAGTATSDAKKYNRSHNEQREDDRQRHVAVRVIHSSAGVETASIPMKEKKIIPAAAVIPWTPKGAKSARLLEFQPNKPIMMNMIRMAILIRTMMVCTGADSLAARIAAM